MAKTVVQETEFLNAIAVISPLLSFHCGVVSVKASILLVLRDGEDKDFPITAIRLSFHLFFRLILICFLLNLKKGSHSNAAAVHVLSIHYVKTFPTTLNLAHEKGGNICIVTRV